MELLAPAGSLEKVKYALYYGADAVYAAGKQFGLRAKATNLNDEQLSLAVRICREQQKRIYITLNIFAHNEDYIELPAYIEFLAKVGVDAVIVSDPGVFSLVKDVAPELPIHISTQANTTSWKAAEFWWRQGAKRVILARELSAFEIKEIVNRVPEIEYEVFCHGAMCISYSGRCLLSSYLNNRDANRGLCTHPCRWKYNLHESSRPGQEFQIEEDDYGTYILNSKDLCLYDHLEELHSIGVTSVKIEGRMKSIYYVANTVRVYKNAIVRLSSGRLPSRNLREELDKISHRVYSTGFFSGYDQTEFHQSSSYIRDYQFLGEVVDVSSLNDGAKQRYVVTVSVKAKFVAGEKIEIIFPECNSDVTIEPPSFKNSEGVSIYETKPNTIVTFVIDINIPDQGLLRKRIHE